MSKKLLAIDGVPELIEVERAKTHAGARKAHIAAHKAFSKSMVEMFDTHANDAKVAGNPDAARRIKATRDWFKIVAKEVVA